MLLLFGEVACSGRLMAGFAGGVDFAVNPDTEEDFGLGGWMGPRCRGESAVLVLRLAEVLGGTGRQPPLAVRFRMS
ncbi:hypothetical protein [Streptomyces tubercidicus]